MGVSEKDQRYWVMDKSGDGFLRPSRPLSPDEMKQDVVELMQALGFLPAGYSSQELYAPVQTALEHMVDVYVYLELPLVRDGASQQFVPSPDKGLPMYKVRSLAFNLVSVAVTPA